MRRKIIYSIVIAVLLICCIYKVWTIYYDRRVPNFEKASQIYVHPGVSKDSVLRMICRKTGVKSKKSLERVLQGIDTIKVGHYTISNTNTSIYVGRMLSHGWQTPINLVIPEYLRRESQIVRTICRQMLLDSSDVINAMRDSSVLAKYGFTKEDIFAFFVPSTYQVFWTDSISSILDMQKKAYDGFWSKENRAKADSLGLTRMQVSILASIVMGETKLVEDMPVIAAVYLNRLRLGMKLQADPTVAYCFDYKLNRILNVHTRVDSPFNTYKNFGLPPHPIMVPSINALNAVLNPDKNNYLFFCASPQFNGKHIFAQNYREHLKNARAFQRALTVWLEKKKQVK